MKITLTGVLEDGTPRKPGVPLNPRANLNVPRGVDLELVVKVVTPLGIPVSLETGSPALVLTIKRTPQESPPRLTKTATLAGSEGTFLIVPGDVRQLQPGLYSYDVWLTKDGLRDPVIPLSPFNLQASATSIP